jgi:hypothetical protein
VISQTSTGVHWRTLTTSFSGQEREDEEIPPWVCDALLKAEFPYVRELKCAFVLQPKEGSNLPSLLQSRLNAPRILQVKKVRWAVGRAGAFRGTGGVEGVERTRGSWVDAVEGVQYRGRRADGREAEVREREKGVTGADGE